MNDGQQDLGGPGAGHEEPHAVIVREEMPAPVAAPAEPEDTSLRGMMHTALKLAGPDAVAALERLVALEVQREERNARKEFAGAMARFKALLAKSPIVKDKSRDQGTDPGTSFKSTWASAAAIAKSIDPILAECGLSYRWTYKPEDAFLKTTCVVSHVNGHIEETPVWIPTESRAGMSPQQKFASAQAYGDRLSLIGAFGLTTAEADQPAPVDVTPITKEQGDALMKNLGANNINLMKFLKAMNVGSLAELPAARLSEAELAISQAIKARQEKDAREGRS